MGTRTRGRSDVLGPANWSSENKTIPIHPQTMSALLVWALRFVENFSDDILTAKTMKSAPHQVSANLAVLSRRKNGSTPICANDKSPDCPGYDDET